MTTDAPVAMAQGQKYPIVAQNPLDPKERRGLLGLGRRSRDQKEVPRPNGHQVLIYRIDGQDIADNGALKLSDEQVVEATYVSLVDVRRNAQVRVRLMLASRDNAEFALQVTFSCTVTDPVTIVRDGVVSAEPILESYLMSHAKILELGLDFDLSELNEVRRQATAQIRAFVAVRPIIVPGMKVDLAGIEVLTPEELKALGSNLRSTSFDGKLESQRMQQEQTRERMRIAFEQEQARLRHAHDQRLEGERQRFERSLQKENDLPAPDARQALYLALTNKSLTPTQYQEKLSELDEREFNRFQAAQRDDAEWEREKQKLELEARFRFLELSEQRQHQQLQWTREERLQAEQYAREERTRELDMKLNVLREFAKRGHLDLVNLNVDKLVADLVPAAAEVGGESKPELTGQEDDKTALPKGTDPADELDSVAEVRDEDVN